MPPTDERRTRDIEHHPLERATDKSKLAILNTKLAEWRAIILLVVGVAVWLGWTQESPSARVEKVEHKIEGVIDSVRVIRQGQKVTHDALEVLVRLRCFDTTLSARDMRLAGLDCSDIERARRSGALYDTTTAVMKSK